MHARLQLVAAMMCWAASACGSAEKSAPCVRQIGDMCLLLRITGTAEGGDLGFRFGPPLDVSGDGVADLAAGARFTRFPEAPHDNVGTASIWSGTSATPLLYWRGTVPQGLFGHSVLLLPDLDGDDLADMVVAAPTGRPDRRAPIGTLWARSGITGKMLWTRSGRPGDSFGWDLAMAGDHDRDGREDLLVGAPGDITGKVYLVSGRDGSILRTYASSHQHDSFGWYVTRVPDLDDDGLDDLGVGAPLTVVDGRRLAGAAHILSSATGATLLSWQGNAEFAQFGEVVCALPDIDGDGKADIAVSATHGQAREGALAGEVFVYSGATGTPIHHFQGRQERELYGRMIARAGDYDGDGVEDLAVSAPWYAADGMARAGRMEIRSGRTGDVLVELVGDAPERWFGWHVEYAPDIGRKHERGLLISLIRSHENGLQGAGALELYAYRRAR